MAKLHEKIVFLTEQNKQITDENVSLRQRLNEALRDNDLLIKDFSYDIMRMGQSLD